MEDGRVVTPECMKEPYRKGYELGWAALNASPEYGGQGAPASVGLAVNEGINAGNPGLSRRDCFETLSLKTFGNIFLHICAQNMNRERKK